jgi:hypothetical protein
MQKCKVEDGEDVQGSDGFTTSNAALKFRDKKLEVEGLNE